jgi:uncharacterized protein YqeY
VVRRDTLRMLLAAIQQEEVDTRRTLADEDVQAILVKQAKQRHESIADAERAGRVDLAANERAELAIIENYLPQMMSRDEIRVLATETIADLGVTDVKGMGQVMGHLMPQLKGRADGRVVSDVVRELLR